MLKKLAAAAVHLAFFALVVAIAGYWGVRIFTPAPTAAPPPLPPPPLRDPDPVATARMFGKVEVVQAVRQVVAEAAVVLGVVELVIGEEVLRAVGAALDEVGGG